MKTNTKTFPILCTIVLEQNWPRAVGSPIQVSRKGKASPLEVGRGKEFTTSEPEKGRGQVGWIPRLVGGEESRPCNHITLSRKPRLVGGSFTAEAVKRQDGGSQES